MEVTQVANRKEKVNTMKHAFCLMAVLSFFLAPAPAQADFESAVHGLNSIVTAPFDPFYGLITGTIPGAEELKIEASGFFLIEAFVVNRVLATAAGAFYGYVRIVAGVIEVVTSPFGEPPFNFPSAGVTLFAAPE